MKTLTSINSVINKQCHPRAAFFASRLVGMAGISIIIISLLFIACSKDNPVSGDPINPVNTNGTLIYSSPDSLVSSGQTLVDSLDLRNNDSLIVTYRFRVVSGTVTALQLSQNTPIYPPYELSFHNGGGYIEYRFACWAKHLYPKLIIYCQGGANYRIRDFKMYKK